MASVKKRNRNAPGADPTCITCIATIDRNANRHEGACRLLGDGVDIRTIQLMLGHADIKQTQRYLNITDEELRRSMRDSGSAADS